MKRKLMFCIIISSIMAISTFAMEYNGSLSFSMIPQDKCLIATYQNDFIFFQDKALRMGPTFEAGWSIAHFDKFGANVLIYGYVLCGGVKLQYRAIPNLYVDCDIKSSIFYATFPQLLWGELDLGTTYYTTKYVFVRGTAGLLMSEDYYRFKGGVSCGIKL